MTPGVRQLVPASEPLTLYVTGELSGGGPCQGKMVFKGVAEPGATCPELVFDGRVEGVPGVDHFWGAAVGGVAQEFLYDSDGRIVGSDQPQVISNFDHFTDRLRPEGSRRATSAPRSGSMGSRSIRISCSRPRNPTAVVHPGLMGDWGI